MCDSTPVPCIHCKCDGKNQKTKFVWNQIKVRSSHTSVLTADKRKPKSFSIKATCRHAGLYYFKNTVPLNRFRSDGHHFQMPSCSANYQNMTVAIKTK